MKQQLRTERFHTLMTKQERQMLDDLANRDGIKGADVVRRLIREAHRAINKKRAA